MIAIRIPSPLRALAGGSAEVQVEGATVGAALDDLARRHPGLKDRLLDPRGALRPYMNVFVNDEDARSLGGLATPLADGDGLALIPAIAGG